MREIKLRKGKLTLNDGEVIGFFDKPITRFGNGAKIDAPSKHTGKRVYVLVTKHEYPTE